MKSPLKKHIGSILLFFLLQAGMKGENTYCFWIEFTDKNNNEYSVSNPRAFLSQKAIERRTVQGIPLNSTDLPVSESYVSQIKSTGLKIQYSLKWLNGVVAWSNDSSLVLATENLNFVKKTELIGLFNSSLKSTGNKFEMESQTSEEFQQSFSQLKLENGFYLHNNGLKGKGMEIAVIDAGFLNANNLSVFDHLWLNNKILSQRDFSTSPQRIFVSHQHGTNVLSILGGYAENQLEGSAYEASFHLLRTEVTAYEQPIEEYNWCAAAEYADSTGVDIINTSLGYNYFDAPFKSHQYADMNGKKNVISRAATMASRKGMLVITSAGNEGNNAWHYITAPADADSIISTGATDSFGNVAGFSSRGPSFDHRVKPDIAAMGASVTFQQYNGNIEQGNGTSFSAPVISGLAACLWQAFPKADNMEVRNAILQSASLFNSPDDNTGYGIPDFELAYELLNNLPEKDIFIKLFPNPLVNTLNIWLFLKKVSKAQFKIYNLQSQLVFQENVDIDVLNYSHSFDLSFLQTGCYLFMLETDDVIHSKHIIKISP